MIILSAYKDSNVAIFGMGITGMAMAESFIAGGANVFLFDDNDIKLMSSVAELVTKYPNANISMEYCKSCDWSMIDMLALSPGISFLKNPHNIVNAARKFNCRIVNDIELFWEVKKDNAKFICVTGTNGKSTTAALITHILNFEGLSTELIGNIGISALSANNADIYVIELSSFQLDLLDKAYFDISILLNITPDHLDRYNSFQDYCNSKKRIFYNQKICSILNIDDNCCKDIVNADYFKNNVIFVSLVGSSNADIVIFDNNIFSIKENKVLVELLDNNIFPIALNKISILTAYCSCVNFVSKNTMISAISSFKPLEHRMEIVCEYNNILFINDSKATNIESALFALSSLKNIYWIAGGKDKNCDLSLALNNLHIYFNKIIQCFTIGETGAILNSEFLKNGIKSIFCENLNKAFELAVKDALLSDKSATILFSPGFASFDQWKDFNERGKAFKNLIMNLI